MSAVPSISIFCDHDGDTLCSASIVLEVIDVDDARRDAEPAGWVSESGNDYCPTHTPMPA